jgi:carboxymethylenebutenolidase
VDVKTPDGIADCYLAHPADGRHPGVILWPDFMSRRPAYQQMADKLARSGYSVLVINQYYRDAKSPLMEIADFDNEPVMQRIFALAKTLTPERTDIDARAFVAFLDSHASVDAARKVGTVGYCIAGRYAFRTAASVPARVGALAAFHAGGLVTDEPTSPHRLIPALKAHALIGIAADDDGREPQTKDTLREAFAQAKLPAEIEVYGDTVHGWCTPDMTAYYHEAQAKRAWTRMLALFERALS